MALPAGSQSQLQSAPVSNVTIDAESTYYLDASLQTAGQSIKGVRVGYVRPNQGYQPFTGTPRVYDSRSGAKLQPNEERTIALGVPGTISAAVFNLTVTQTEGVAPAGGFVAAFSNDIAWPGNSSINWTGSQDVANTTLSAVDGSGRIRLRGGGNATHVIVDLIGILL